MNTKEIATSSSMAFSANRQPAPPTLLLPRPRSAARFQQVFVRFFFLTIYRLPPVLCVLLAVGIWLIFRPALMSKDSMEHYWEALKGEYRDWHPPIIAILLRSVMLLGGDLEHVTLIQCLTGCLGVYALAVQCLRALYRGVLAKRLRPWLALLVLVALLCPLSPLMFFLAGFVKDTWAMILLAWIVALLWGLYERKRVGRYWRGAALLTVTVWLMVFFAIVRHNAVVVLPSCALCLFAVLRRWRVHLAWNCLAIAGLFVLSFGSSRAISWFFDVKPTHPENQVMALDLVGLCVRDESLRHDLPFTSSHLVEDLYRTRYTWGDPAPMYWAPPMIVTEGYGGMWYQNDPAAHAALQKEYWHAVRKHGWELAHVKWRAFVFLFGLKRVYWIPVDVAPYKSDMLALNVHHERLRQDLYNAALFVHGHRLLHWVGAVHLVWIVANLVWIFGALAAYAVHRSGRCLFVAMLLALPLNYSASYLLATTAHDFRMMYPATLVIQILSLAALFGGLVALNRSAGKRQPCST